MEKYKAKCELRAFLHLTHSPDCKTRCWTALMWKWPRNEPVVARGGLYKVPMIGKRYSFVQCSPPGTSRRSVLIWWRRPAASSVFEQSNWVVVTRYSIEDTHLDHPCLSNEPHQFAVLHWLQHRSAVSREWPRKKGKISSWLYSWSLHDYWSLHDVIYIIMATFHQTSSNKV